MVKGAKYGARQFLSCHGQAETVTKFRVVSAYPARYALPRATQIDQSQAKISARDAGMSRSCVSVTPSFDLDAVVPSGVPATTPSSETRCRFCRAPLSPTRSTTYVTVGLRLTTRHNSDWPAATVM